MLKIIKILLLIIRITIIALSEDRSKIHFGYVERGNNLKKNPSIIQTEPQSN